MKRRRCRLTATAVVLACFTTVSVDRAFASSRSIEQQPESKPTTIVGCLVKGLPSTAGAEAGSANAGSSDYFIRTPTVRVPPGTTVAVGAPGTASTATSIGTPVEDSFYRVEGLADEALAKHVGHRLELTGHLTDNQPGIEERRVTTKQDAQGRATTTVETRIALAGVLRATTVKMISASCQK